MADPAPITRSEAAWRLKAIGAKITNAVSLSREGRWKDAAEIANDAQNMLSQILPHLDDAAEQLGNLVGSLGFNPPSPERTGGLGYRGSKHHDTPYQNRGPIPQPIPKPVPIVEELPPVTFNLARIVGQPEFIASFKTGSVEPLSTDELAASKQFDALDPALKQKIRTQYERTGKPVTVKLKVSRGAK